MQGYAVDSGHMGLVDGEPCDLLHMITKNSFGRLNRRIYHGEYSISKLFIESTYARGNSIS